MIKTRHRLIREFNDEAVKSSKADVLLNIFGRDFLVFCVLMQ